MGAAFLSSMRPLPGDFGHAAGAGRDAESEAVQLDDRVDQAEPEADRLIDRRSEILQSSCILASALQTDPHAREGRKSWAISFPTPPMLRRLRGRMAISTGASAPAPLRYSSHGAAASRTYEK